MKEFIHRTDGLIPAGCPQRAWDNTRWCEREEVLFYINAGLTCAEAYYQVGEDWCKVESDEEEKSLELQQFEGILQVYFLDQVVGSYI